MKSKYYIFSLVVLLVGLFPFYVNLVAASNFIYGGQIFHHDISKAVSLEYLSYLKFLIILSASTLITFLIINKVSGINCFSMIRDKFYFKIDFSNEIRMSEIFYNDEVEIIKNQKERKEEIK